MHSPVRLILILFEGSVKQSPIYVSNLLLSRKMKGCSVKVYLNVLWYDAQRGRYIGVALWVRYLHRSGKFSFISHLHTVFRFRPSRLV